MLKSLFKFAILSTAILANNSFSSSSIDESFNELSLSTAIHTTQESTFLDVLPDEMILKIFSYLDPKELTLTRRTCHQLKEVSEELLIINNKENSFLNIKNNTGASVIIRLIIQLNNEMKMPNRSLTSDQHSLDFYGHISKYQSLENGEILSLSKRDIDRTVRESSKYKRGLYSNPLKTVFVGRNIFKIDVKYDAAIQKNATGVISMPEELIKKLFWEDLEKIISLNRLAYLNVKKSIKRPFELIGNKKDGFKLKE